MANLLPVNTECAAGELDINTASAAAIAQRLHLLPDTAARIIALRPWLRGSDLSSVPGVVPRPDLSAWLPAPVCATQPQIPPASALACVPGGRAVDLQSASPLTMLTRLGIDPVTAHYLIAARPLPQNLAQIETPRIPTFVDPIVRGWLAAGLICVTPAPMEAAGAELRWATPAGGAVVTRGGFSLIVPPGRILDPKGAYISVAPLPAAGDVLPQMAAHIYGDWTSGTDPVAVVGPWVGQDGGSPVVLRDSSDGGTTMSVGSGTHVTPADANGPATVTALEYSLGSTTVAHAAARRSATVTPLVDSTSQTTFGVSLCNQPPGQLGAYSGSMMCIHSLTDGSLPNQWAVNASASGLADAATVSPTPVCGYDDIGSASTARSSGKLPFGVLCQIGSFGSSDKYTWPFQDVAEASILGGAASAGVLYDYDVHGGTTAAVSVNGNGEGDAALRVLENAVRPYLNVLFPEQILSVTKGVSSGSTSVDITADRDLSGLWSALTNIVGTVGDTYALWRALDPVGIDAQLSDCVIHLKESAGACLKDLADAAFKQLLAPKKEGGAGLKGLAKDFFETAGKVLKALDIASFLASYVLAFGSDVGQLFGGGHGAVISNDAFPPIPPGGGGGGGPAPTSYIAHDPNTRQSVFVDGSHVHAIPDGGTFLCLAKSRFVYDIAGLAVLVKPANAPPATCTTPGPGWDYKPIASGGNVPNNVILREDPADATHGVIASWLINSSGAIQTIPDGGTYLCLATANPVIWNVRFADVQAWKPVGTAPASCGAAKAIRSKNLAASGRGT